MVAYYYFDGNGRGTYSLYYEGHYSQPVSRDDFSYYYNDVELKLHYYSGNSDTFSYTFLNGNHFRLGYYDRNGRWQEEFYFRNS